MHKGVNFAVTTRPWLSRAGRWPGKPPQWASPDRRSQFFELDVDVTCSSRA